MNKMTNLPREGVWILFWGIIGIVLLSFVSCSTTSIHGCDNKIGPEKDECIEEYYVKEAEIERKERYLENRTRR